MDPHRDYPEDPRWYGGDGGWDPAAVRAPEARPDGGGLRVPEPRGADAEHPRYPGAGVEPRYVEADRYGRYGDSDGGPDASFPGFQPARLPAEPAGPSGSSGPGSMTVPATYPDPPTLPVGPPPSADPTVTAERSLALDLPTGPYGPSGPPAGTPAGSGLAGLGLTGPGTPDVPEAAMRYHAEPIDRAALRRPNGPVAPVGDGVYRTRRPALVIALAVVVGLLEIPALLLLGEGAFGDVLSPSAIVAGTCLALGLPATGLGVYALITGAGGVGGAGRTPDQSPLQAWLRPPLAYLGIGLLLILAAALAAA